MPLIPDRRMLGEHDDVDDSDTTDGYVVTRQADGTFALEAPPPSGASGATPTALTDAPDGGWSWFTEPRGLDYNGQTIFGYVAGDSGDVVARSYDHATETLSAETVLHAALDVDDHANPSFLVRASDRKVIAFYTAHNDTGGLRYRVSSSAEDVSAFAAEQTIDPGGTGYDYASPHQLAGETDDPIYLFFRDSAFGGSPHRKLAFTKSTDGGATWAAQTTLVNGSGRIPYWKHCSSGGDRIDFAVSDGHPYNDGANDLVHFYYQGGSYYATDGTELAGAPPFATSSMTPVWTTGKSWVHDITIGADGHPRIVFAYFPTDDDHRYRYARWTGDEWVTSEMVPAGSNINPTIPTAVHYSGGVALDHQDPRVVYASVEVLGQWEMFRYLTLDGGTTWHVTRLTESSSAKQLRPFSVRGHHSGPLSVLWMSGTYTSSVAYSVGTIESATVLPHTEPGDYAAPDHTHDYAAADHTHTSDDITDLSAFGLVPVHLPSVSVDDTDPDEVTVTVTSLWGVDSSGEPYYDSANVTSGEEAALLIDPTDASLHVRALDES